MIVNPEIERYIESLLPERDDVLCEMEEYAAQHKVPIIGPAVATMLAGLVRLTGARRIFELGSAIGYSTIWLARAAGEGAEVHYSDGSSANAERARGYFKRAGVEERITIHVGDALGALAAVDGEFDFIFNDVDKEGYPAVLEVAPGRLKLGDYSSRTTHCGTPEFWNLVWRRILGLWNSIVRYSADRTWMCG
jgi:caffeoyl-CoA O-methyltransferase